MGLRTNSTDRLSGRVGTNVTELFDATDFPNAPSGGKRIVNSGTYVIQKSFAYADDIEIPGGETVIFNAIDEDASMAYSGTGTAITSLGNVFFALRAFVLVMTQANARMFNIIGGSTSIKSMLFLGFGANQTFGEWTDAVAVTYRQSVAEGFTNGFIFNDVEVFNPFQARIASSGTGTGSIFTFNGKIKTFVVAEQLRVVTGPNEAVWDIDPNIGTTPTINIDGVINDGSGSYFKAGTTGAITNITDDSFSAISITGVSVSGQFARFAFSPGPALFANQVLTVSGYVTNTLYNDTGFIDVTGTGFFELRSVSTGLPISFGTDEAGGVFKGDTVTVTSTAHGQSNGQTLLITDTIDYNGGFSIYNALTNTYRIDTPFVTAETTGNWDTGSLTERDKRLNVQDNGLQQDSMNVAFGGMNANAGATTISAADTYQAMDFNTIIQDPTTERWTLIDATNGIFRYDGANPVTGTMVASITVVKTGSTEIYRFTESLNGAIPVFATKAYMPIEVKSTQVSGTLIRPISVVPGDTIQVMGAAQTTTDNVTVTDFFMEMMF